MFSEGNFFIAFFVVTQPLKQAVLQQKLSEGLLLVIISKKNPGVSRNHLISTLRSISGLMER